MAANADNTSPEAKQIILLASDARIRALRIQALLPPHIAEESPQKMDELEALMTIEDREVRKDMGSLAVLLKASGSPDLKTATSCYGNSAGSKRRSSSSPERTPMSALWPSR